MIEEISYILLFIAYVTDAIELMAVSRLCILSLSIMVVY